MLINFFTTILLFTSPVHSSGDSLTLFQKSLWRDLCLSIGLPPESNARDTCFHYSELMKVEINKFSKVVSLQFSDSAPEWVKNELDNAHKRKKISYMKLDSLALKEGLRDCTFVFPFIIESEDFPCGIAKKKRNLSSKYFKFNGRNLKGNIIFGEEVKYPISVNYKTKTVSNKKNVSKHGKGK